MNCISLTGRLGNDPEYRVTDKCEVCNISLATRGYKKGDTDWHKVVLFGKQATNAKSFLAKGSLVSVSGRLTYNKWVDETGNTRITSQIIASDIEYLDKAKNKPTEDGNTENEDNDPENGLPF